MRSPRREFRPARDARYHRISGGLPTQVPSPLRRTNNEDDDAQYILAPYTYTLTSAPFLEVCTSVLRLVVHFGVLVLASSVEFRWKTVETVTSWHLWLDNAACPLHCWPISFLFGFIWIQDLIQSKECHHPIENEKSFPLMSNMTRYDEMKKNCGQSKMWSVMHMVSCTIFPTHYLRGPLLSPNIFVVENYAPERIDVTGCLKSSRAPVRLPLILMHDLPSNPTVLSMPLRSVTQWMNPGVRASSCAWSPIQIAQFIKNKPVNANFGLFSENGQQEEALTIASLGRYLPHGRKWAQAWVYSWRQDPLRLF